MMGVTPASAYCGAKLSRRSGSTRSALRTEFPGVARHLGGIGALTLDREWLCFHAEAFQPGAKAELVDVGEFRYRNAARAHVNGPDVVRTLHAASGYAKPRRQRPARAPPTRPTRRLVNERAPISVLDLLKIVPHAEPIPLDEVETEEHVLWRFMAPGMSEGALSEPAHRAVARAMNVLHRYCLWRFRRSGVARRRPGIGPIANCGEGGFDKARIGRPRRQPQHPVRRRALHHHADDRRARGRGRGEVRAGRQARQGRPASRARRSRRASRTSAAASRASSWSRRP